jgi:hypothetical protein
MVLLRFAGLFAAFAVALWYLPRNSQRLWRYTARITAGFLACAAALALLGFLLRGMMCGQREFAPVSSSDGSRLAQVSEVDCSAVDHFHSSVEVWRNRQGFFALIFGKRARPTTIFTVSHDPRLIDLAWKDGQTLVIRFPNDSPYIKEYRCDSEWDGVRIECIGYLPDYDKYVAQMPPVHRWFW